MGIAVRLTDGLLRADENRLGLRAAYLQDEGVGVLRFRGCTCGERSGRGFSPIRWAGWWLHEAIDYNVVTGSVRKTETWGRIQTPSWLTYPWGFLNLNLRWDRISVFNNLQARQCMMLADAPSWKWI
jgi:hypothetical protein